MSKRTIGGLILLAALAGVYAVFFSGWFSDRSIQVVVEHQAPRRSGPVLIPFFGFDRDYAFERIEVRPLWNDALEAAARAADADAGGVFTAEADRPDPEPVVIGPDELARAVELDPVWIALRRPDADEAAEDERRRPRPVRAFRYGQRLRGMQRPEDLRRPQRLEPHRWYRLRVFADGKTAELDFQARPSS